MSKIRLVLPGNNRAVLINNPFSTKEWNFNNLLKVINFLSIVAFFVFTLLLPFSGQLLSTDLDSSVLKFLIICILFLLVLFLIKILLSGGKDIIDPKGFLMVLVFNLILTSASVLIVSTRVSNTFGTNGFRYLAGITQMILIGVFYFVNLYTQNSKYFKYTINLLTLGSILFVVWQLALSSGNGAFVITNLCLIVLSLMLVGYKSIANTEFRLAYTLGFVIYLLVVLLSIPFNTLNYSNLFYFTIAFLVAYTLVLMVFAQKNKKYLKQRFKEIFTNIKNFLVLRKTKLTPTVKGLADFQLIMFFVMPFILILVGLFFYLNIPRVSQDVVTPVLSQYGDAFKLINGGDSLNLNNIRGILFGLGSDNYNLNEPFLVNVLIVQGVVGLVIYAVLWLYFLNRARISFLVNLKSKTDFKLSGIIFITAIFIPLTLVFGFTNLLSIVVLWICYALTNTINLKSTTYLNSEALSIDNSNKLKYYSLNILRIFIIIIAVIVAVYLTSFIFGIVK